MRSPLPARLLGVAVTALLVLGGAAAAPAAAAEPLSGAPRVGACYDLTLKQAFTESTGEATVACSTKHTLLVGAVGEVPASVGWDDDEAVADAASTICSPFWRKFYDNRSPLRYLSLHQAIWLIPTPAQRAAGARWISCSIGLSDGAKLLPLGKGAPAKATATPADSVARCVAGKKRQTVVCSKPHQWRATQAFSFKASGGEKAVSAAAAKAAARRCGPRMKAPGWLWTWRTLPIKNTYAVICVDKTRR